MASAYVWSAKMFNHKNLNKMKATVNNQNRVGEMSMQLNYELAQVFNCPKGYVWNTRRRFR